MPLSSMGIRNQEKYFEKNQYFYQKENSWNIPIRSCNKTMNFYHKKNIKNNEKIKIKIEKENIKKMKNELNNKKQFILKRKIVVKENYNKRLSERMALELRTNSLLNYKDKEEIIDIDPWKTKMYSLSKTNLKNTAFNQKPGSIWNNYSILNKKYTDQIWTEKVLKGEYEGFKNIKNKLKIEKHIEEEKINEKIKNHHKILNNFNNKCKLIKNRENDFDKTLENFNKTMNFYNSSLNFNNSINNKFMRTQNLSVSKKNNFKFQKEYKHYTDFNNMVIVNLDSKNAVFDNNLTDKIKNIPYINKKFEKLKLNDYNKSLNSNNNSFIDKDHFRKSFYKYKIENFETEKSKLNNNNTIENIQKKIIENKESIKNSPISNIKTIIKTDNFTYLGDNIVKIKRKVIFDKKKEIKNRSNQNKLLHEELNEFEKNLKNNKKINFNNSKKSNFKFKELDKNCKILFDKYPKKK